MMSRDRQRTSAARKQHHRQRQEREQQQAEVLRKLWAQAKVEEKSS
jgi:hypothetical protein